MSGYWNEINPKETKEIIQNERDCFRTRAEADAALEASGRFKRQNETRVTGAAPVTYPALPSGPWGEGDLGAPDPLTNELGYDISVVEPILDDRRDATSANGASPAVDVSAPEEPTMASRSAPPIPADVGGGSSHVQDYDRPLRLRQQGHSTPPQWRHRLHLRPNQTPDDGS